MSLDISYYRKINNGYKASGTVSKKESDIYALKLHMANTFSDSLDYHDETLRNMVKQRFVISYYRDENKRKITAFPNEILNMGDMIDCFDSKWLTTYINSDQQVYTKGIIQKCNYTLPFQTISSAIIQEPCIVIDTTKASSTGEDEGKIITLSDTQRAILIQYNENTKYLIEGKRIFIDQLTDKPKVYKITKVDRISYIDGEHGLLELTCDECEVIPDKDKPEIKIAGYISTEPTIPPTPSDVGMAVIANTKNVAYTTKVKIKVGTIGKPFVALFKNLSGDIISDIQPKWSLMLPNELTDKVQIDYKSEFPNRCYVSINDDRSLIGKSFKLKLIDDKTLYGKCEININITSLYG